MEEKLTNLLNTTPALRTRDSIKYMISVFKQIQKHPNEEKYYRIFKGRAKLRKHVWTLRNAKLFMIASGWTEIGSFVIFPLSKQIEGPLLLLNKYLSLAEEKSIEENSSPGKQDQSNLRRASSSDLAERIMELKEALNSSKTNSHKTNKFSNGIKNRESKILQRAVSMDEVNILRTNEEASSPMRKESTSKDNEFQERRIHVEEKENEPGYLRRSVSENALHVSPENDDYELTSTFSPFTRKFSQRSVKEQEISCDIVMENPLHLDTTPIAKEPDQGSICSSDEEDLITQNNLIAVPHQRQSVRSPQEAALEEADQLSTVLGNLIHTLGSSTDSERETDSEKETKKELRNGKLSGKARDQNKDEELEALCATLDMLIHDNSDSSSEGVNENIEDRKPYSLRQRGNRNSDFKPPLPNTKKKTQQLEKSKSLDKSNRGLMANGRSNRDRISKAKSVDLAQVGSNRRPRDRATDVTQNISKRIQKNTTNGREISDNTRAQRQKEANHAALLGSTNRQDTAPKKQNSGAQAPKRTDKRPALKTKSVDIERKRTRPPVPKSKSLDQQESELKTTRRSQVKKAPRRSSSSEDDKKPPRLRIADKTRMKTRGQNSRRGNNQAPLTKNSKRKGETSIAEQGKMNTEPSSQALENSIKKGTSAQTPPYEENPSVNNQENAVKIDEGVTFAEKTSCEQVIQEQGDSWTVMNIKPEPVEHTAEDNANLKLKKQKNESRLVEADETNDVLVENRNEIIKLSKEIRSHYNEDDTQWNVVDDNKNETNKQDGVLKVKQWFPSDSEIRGLVQDGERPSALRQEEGHEEVDCRIAEDANPVNTESANSDYTRTDPQNRKMTLLDIGKQQSKERVKRKEVVSLSLEERKQQILDATVSKPKAKPADKRRSILQIKSRSDGNLVKNKKEAFEKPKVAHATSDSSVTKSSKQRHFRLRGRRKKSFELSSTSLEVLAEDHEENLEETPAANGKSHTNQENGVTTSVEQIGEEKVEKGKVHSPVKISPFQLHFKKRRGSYDLEKRASSSSLESPRHHPGEYE